jgi:hypothetical protein
MFDPEGPEIFLHKKPEILLSGSLEALPSRVTWFAGNKMVESFPALAKGGRFTCPFGFNGDWPSYPQFAQECSFLQETLKTKPASKKTQVSFIADEISLSILWEISMKLTTEVSKIKADLVLRYIDKYFVMVEG